MDDLTVILRIAKYIAIEKEAREEQEWDLAERARTKSKEAQAELQHYLDNLYGSPPRCPFCRPALLELPPSLNMRQCVTHSLPLIAALHGLKRFPSDGPGRSPYLATPTYTPRTTFTAAPVPDSAESNTRSTTSNESPKRRGARSVASNSRKGAPNGGASSMKDQKSTLPFWPYVPARDGRDGEE